MLEYVFYKKQDNTSSNLDYFVNKVIILFAFIFPLTRSFSNILIFIMLGCFLAKIFKEKKFYNRSTIWIAFLFSSLFLLHLAGYFYTEDHNQSKALSSLFKYSPLIIFPLTISAFTNVLVKNKLSIFIAFILSCLTICFSTLLYALYKNNQFNQLKYLNWEYFDTDLPLLFKMSHVYFGLYLVFAIMVIMLINLEFKFKKRNRLLSFIVGCIFIFYLFLMTAKMAIISLGAIAVCILIHYILKEKKWVLGGSFLTIIILITYLSLHFFINFQRRFKDLLDNSNYKIENNHANSISVRFSTFTCSYELFKENSFFGVGLGDSQEALNNCYNSKGLTNLSFRNFNSHNQFLYFAFTYGLFGLLIFIICLGIPLIMSFKNDNYYYSYFILLIVLCCLTENVINSNKGILFYSFFNSVIFFSATKFNKTKFVNPRTQF